MLEKPEGDQFRNTTQRVRAEREMETIPIPGTDNVLLMAGGFDVGITQRYYQTPAKTNLIPNHRYDGSQTDLLVFSLKIKDQDNKTTKHHQALSG